MYQWQIDTRDIRRLACDTDLLLLLPPLPMRIWLGIELGKDGQSRMEVPRNKATTNNR